MPWLCHIRRKGSVLLSMALLLLISHVPQGTHEFTSAHAAWGLDPNSPRDATYSSQRIRAVPQPNTAVQTFNHTLLSPKNSGSLSSSGVACGLRRDDLAPAAICPLWWLRRYSLLASKKHKLCIIHWQRGKTGPRALKTHPSALLWVSLPSHGLWLNRPTDEICARLLDWGNLLLHSSRWVSWIRNNKNLT